jgi:hypothetical protein
MAPSAGEEPSSPTSDGSYSAAVSGPGPLSEVPMGRAILPPYRCVPDRNPWSNSHRPYPLSPSWQRHRAAERGSVRLFPGPVGAEIARLWEEKRDLRRSDAYLRRLRCRVRALGRRSRVLHTEGVRLGPETVFWLPGGKAIDEGLRAERQHRRPKGILRGALLTLRQSSPGPVQAPHGSTGLLLGLLPRGPRGGRIRALAIAARKRRSGGRLPATAALRVARVRRRSC